MKSSSQRPLAAKGLGSAKGGMRSPTIGGSGSGGGVSMPPDNSNMSSSSGNKISFNAGAATGKRGSRGY